MDRFDDSAGLFGTLTPRGSLRARTEERPATQATPAEVFALVYTQMRRLAGSRDVDELVQAAAEQAIRGLSRFEGRSQLSTWTFRICYLTVRKRDRWYRRWLRRFTLTRDGEVPELADERGSSEAHIAEGERRARLQHALDQLSAKKRAVIVMHDLEGLAIDEIAVIIDATPIAVRSRLRDGRRALAQILKSDPYFGDEACREKVPR